MYILINRREQDEIFWKWSLPPWGCTHGRQFSRQRRQKRAQVKPKSGKEKKTSWNSNNEPPSSFCTTTKGSPQAATSSRSALSFFSSSSHLHWLSSSVFLLQASATDWHPLVQHWVAKRMQNAPNWRRTPCDGLYWPIPSVGKVVNLQSVWVMWGLTTVILIIWTHWVDRRAPTQAPLLSFAAF